MNHSENTHPAAATIAAARLEQPISGLGGGFMSHPSMLDAGRELGYESNDFYYAGRVGVLGEVSATIATAALVFFAPSTVERAWERSNGLQTRHSAALTYTQCASRWAEGAFGEGTDWERIGDDADRVVQSLSVANAPIFAGWLTMPDGESVEARAQHRLNALREYRMAIHAAAIIAAGVSVGDALRHAAPQHIELFGWSHAPDDDPAEVAVRWNTAEATTDRLLGEAFGTLGDDLDGFVERCELAHAGVFPRR